jgi:hypothetical protein
LLGAWEHDLAVPLLLQIVDLRKTRDQLAVVQAINIDNLRGEFGILGEALWLDTLQRGWPMCNTYHAIDHLQNLGLDKLQVLSIASGCATDDVVDTAVIIFTTQAACFWSAHVP